MNYCYNTIDTATDMTPSISAERESIRTIMSQTNERLNEAAAMAEAILNNIRTPMPRKDEERPSVNCMMDAALENRATATRLCDIVKEIGLQLGAGT